jgi:Flp pilus assembly protein TadB
MKRRELSPEEAAERESDPSGLTQYFFRHPWRAGIASGALLFVWMVASVAWPIAIAAGVAVMLFTGPVWRHGGPGQRWRRSKLQRFPEKDRRDS